MLDSGLAIGRADATLVHYRQHLCMLKAWLGPLEAWLSGFDDGPQATLPPLPRIDAIDADLALIDGECGVAGGAAMWPMGASAAYRWGVCYVVEGSQLGGAVLYQRLSPVLAPHPLRYLRGQDAGPGPRWRLFMQALKDDVITDQEIDDACRGACDAFDRILSLRK
jgi:heme oxygenase